MVLRFACLPRYSFNVLNQLSTKSLPSCKTKVSFVVSSSVRYFNFFGRRRLKFKFFFLLQASRIRVLDHIFIFLFIELYLFVGVENLKVVGDKLAGKIKPIDQGKVVNLKACPLTLYMGYC